jgi:hypothetical protein
MVSDFIITDWQAVAINAELIYGRLKIGPGKQGRRPAGIGKPVGRPVASCRQGRRITLNCPERGRLCLIGNSWIADELRGQRMKYGPLKKI